jgi:hypothetical protein
MAPITGTGFSSRSTICQSNSALTPSSPREFKRLAVRNNYGETPRERTNAE